MTAFMQSLSFGELLSFQWAVDLTRYFLFASGAWWVFRKWQRRKSPETGQIRREVFHSVLSVTIFMIPVALLILATRAGHSAIYTDIDQYGWGWYFASYAVLLAWHETYFYWSHRFMHLGPIYRRVHRWHHLSKHPTPFTAFAFHPLEALIESLTLVSVAFFIPLHLSTLAIFAVISQGFNVYGHLGVDLFSHTTRIGGWINSPRSHGLHHERFRGNYSFYTNFWDRMMGTRIGEK
jgi:lathosterol oxidase